MSQPPYKRRNVPAVYDAQWFLAEFGNVQRSQADGPFIPTSDYEEGSWTPTFTGLTTTPGSGAINYSGSYVRIGKLVFARITIQSTGGASTASTANTTRVTNLPFEVIGQAAGSAADNLITSFGVGLFYSGTNAYLPTWATNTGTVFFSGMYITS